MLFGLVCQEIVYFWGQLLAVRALRVQSCSLQHEKIADNVLQTRGGGGILFLNKNKHSI